MIKAKKGLSPIYVHYFDNQSAEVYNLTEEQFQHLLESQDEASDGLEMADKFIVEPGFDDGYAPPELSVLAEIYGFEVGSE